MQTLQQYNKRLQLSRAIGRIRQLQDKCTKDCANDVPIDMISLFDQNEASWLYLHFQMYTSFLIVRFYKRLSMPI